MCQPHQLRVPRASPRANPGPVSPVPRSFHLVSDQRFAMSSFGPARAARWAVPTRTTSDMPLNTVRAPAKGQTKRTKQPLRLRPRPLHHQQLHKMQGRTRRGKRAEAEADVVILPLRCPPTTLQPHDHHLDMRQAGPGRPKKTNQAPLLHHRAGGLAARLASLTHQLALLRSMRLWSMCRSSHHHSVQPLFGACLPVTKRCLAPSGDQLAKMHSPLEKMGPWLKLMALRASDPWLKLMALRASGCR